MRELGEIDEDNVLMGHKEFQRRYGDLAVLIIPYTPTLCVSQYELKYTKCANTCLAHRDRYHDPLISRVKCTANNWHPR